MSSNEEFNNSRKQSRKAKFREIPQKMMTLPEEVNASLQNGGMPSPRKRESPMLSARSNSNNKLMFTNPSNDSKKRLPEQPSLGSLHKAHPTQISDPIDDLAGNPKDFLAKIGFPGKQQAMFS